MKICTKCKSVKSLDQFYKNKTRKDGFTSQCKLCINAKNYKNPNRIEYMQNYRIKNKHKLAIKRAEYYLKNKERESRLKKERRLNNLDEFLEREKIYRKNNYLQKIELNNKRRTKKLNNGVFKVTKKEINKLYSSPCFYCSSTEFIEMDHIIPISKGGRHSIGNLVPACRNCNLDKRDKLLIEWLHLADNRVAQLRNAI